MIGGMGGIWREGKRLVMDRNAQLPDRCVKCNEPAEGYRRKISLTYSSWQSQLLMGALSMINAKSVTLEIPLCHRHRGQRGRLLNAVLLALAGFVGATYAFGQGQAVIGSVLLFAALGALIYGLLTTSVVRAAKIDDQHVWLNGCGEPFLASLSLEPSELTVTAPPPPAPAEVARDAYRSARNGALVFLAGCLITAGTYLIAAGGRYFIVWGAVIVGIIQVVRGVRAYLRVPASERQGMQVVTLVGIIGIGVLALAWVGANEVVASEWNAAIDTAAAAHEKGSTLFQQVVSRPGNWSAQNAADMVQVAGYYGNAADTLAGAPAPPDRTWYRDGMVKNLREGRDIALDLSKLSASSPQSSFDALAQRWSARVADFNQLQSRLKAQTGR